MAAEGLHTEKDVCEEDHMCMHPHPISHTQFLCHMFVFFVSFHPYSTPAYFLPFSPSSSLPPPHTHIYHMHCRVLFQLFPTHSSFPLSNAVHPPTPHCILSLSHLDTQARPGSLHPSVTDDINCHRGNNQRWRQHAGPSGIHPSVFCMALRTPARASNHKILA